MGGFPLATSFLVLIIAMVSCARVTTPTLSTPAAAPLTREMPATETWQQEWDRTVAEAKREGALVITTSAPTDIQATLSQFIKEKYGLNLEFIVGRAGERIEKLLKERSAGLYTTDVYLSGASTAITILKPAGVLERLDPVLFLPEVLDRNAWWGGDLLWYDPEHHMVAFQAIVQQTIVVNKELIKPQEIKSFRDLLHPKYKGKIAMEDPTTSGAGNAAFNALARGIMDLDYLRELAKQEPVFSRDRRLLVEWVARGKYPIGIGIDSQSVDGFITAGAPLEFVMPVEGTYITAAAGAIALINRAPHPNAARFFTNWMLTREGTTIYSRAAGAQSAREDVPTDHLLSQKIRQPGVKYYSDMTEDAEYKKREHQKVAQEIFGHLIK